MGIMIDKEEDKKGLYNKLVCRRAINGASDT